MARPAVPRPAWPPRRATPPRLPPRLSPASAPAPVTSDVMPPDSVHVVRASPGLVWRAYDADQAVGSIRAFLRQDNRWFVGFEPGRDDSYAPLLAAVAANTGADLYATARDNEQAHLSRLARLGFAEHRRQSSYLISTDPAVTGLDGVTEPDDV